MLLRGDHCLFKAAFYGVTSALLLSMSSLVAAAADNSATAIVHARDSDRGGAALAAPVPAFEATTAARGPLPAGVVISGNTMTMAPVPDRGAQRGAARVAATYAAAAPETTIEADLDTAEDSAPAARPSVIIRDGVITMLPVDDRQARHVADVADRGEVSAKPRGEENCLARAIYFEARGESTRGQEAVAQVVLARTRAAGRPDTICGVVYEGSHRSTGCQFSFTCDGIRDTINNREAWALAQDIAERAMSGQLKQVARGATFYHANYVRPYWASSMVKVATIGTHIFYRP